MKKLIRFVLILFVLIQFSCNTDSKIKEESLNPSTMLWYDKPASTWTEAMPLGNGRLGAMVYGGTVNEKIQFNEETLWTGQPHDYTNKGAHNYLDEIRQLLIDGKQEQAHKLGNEHFMSKPFGQLSYQPFGNILLNSPKHENATNFKRILNLENAITTASYEIDEINFKREAFISKPDQALLIRIEASKKGKLNFTAGLNSPHLRYDVTVNGDEIILKGKANNYTKALDKLNVHYPESKITFEARLKVVNEGGELVIEDHSIKVINANAVTLQLVAATSFVNFQDISGSPAETMGG